jgi:(p)ppGpp synthase/HD superfamily hydrolase
MVEGVALKFRHLIYADEPYYTATWIGIYGHDSIEDARLTYNDIKEKFGEVSAEIIFLCTQDKGRNRDARKSDAWYEELKKNDLAVFVKLCDIIANVQFSFLTESSMFKKYKSEYSKKVKPHLYCDQYKEMFEYLEKIFQL